MTFPSSWNWIFEDFVPSWVKTHYPPTRGFGKPFNDLDIRFYSKGLQELSDLFTEDRPKKLPAYFQHPRFRSAYLLYFLQFQGAKFLTLFHTYTQAFEAVLRDGEKKGILRVLDFGCGPGTASLAFLIALMEQASKKKINLPPIELTWIDMQFKIMDDGRKIVTEICNHYPSLRGKVQIKMHTHEFGHEPFSLVLFGNVLNESQDFNSGRNLKMWEKVFRLAQGGGVLILEPAVRKCSQTLSALRDFLIENQWIEAKPSSIWGPCLHAGRCPLSQGRDWCHFSMPVSIPGKTFQGLSRSLGSVRNWLKFSYLWIASSEFPAPIPAQNLRRVVSDPMNHMGRKAVLLCEPERVRKWKVSGKEIRRGECVQESGGPSFESPRHKAGKKN